MRQSLAVLILLAFSICSMYAVAGNQPTKPSKLAANTLLLDISKTNKSYVAVGQRGHVLLSEHCQSTWQQIIVPTQVTLNAVFFVDETHGWIVGHDAVILKTTNGGYDWSLVHENKEASEPLFDVHFFDRHRGLAVGAYGSTMQTVDGGQSWQESPLYGEDDYHLYSITSMSDGELVISGEAGSVYLSVNQGERWEKLKVPYDGSFYGATALKNDSLLIYGMRGHLYISSDLGYSWEKIVVDTQQSLVAATEASNGSVVIVGNAGTVYHSANGKRFADKSLDKRTHRVAIVECNDSGYMTVGESGLEQLKF